ADWHWPLLVAAAFVVPSLAALFASTTLGAEGRRWWHLGVAAGRLAGLTWWSLLGLRDGAAAPVAPGEGRGSARVTGGWPPALRHPACGGCIHSRCRPRCSTPVTCAVPTAAVPTRRSTC